MKIRAHPDFRFVATMNDDASTFELPDYINSRLQPTILVDFPDADEELAILAREPPVRRRRRSCAGSLASCRSAHEADESFSVSDGINVARYALKRLAQGGGEPVARLLESVRFVLGEEAVVHAPLTGDVLRLTPARAAPRVTPPRM